MSDLCNDQRLSALPYSLRQKVFDELKAGRAAQAEAARWESIARTLALRHGLREELAALAAAEVEEGADGE